MPFGDTGDGGQNLARRAITALQPVMRDEGLLYRMQRIDRPDPFDRRDIPPGTLNGECEAGVHPLAIDQHGACPTRTLVTPLLGAGEMQVVAQEIEQCRPRLDDQTLLASKLEAIERLNSN